MSTKKNNKNTINAIAKAINADLNPKSKMTPNQELVAHVMSEMVREDMSWGFAYVPISEILTDMKYQRPTRTCRVNKIVRDFDRNKVDAKCVNYRPDEDKFAMMDGLHTLRAFQKLGRTVIPCKVFVGKTYEEEAEIFASQNKDVKKITNLETYNALLEAKDQSAVDIDTVLKEYGVELATKAGRKKTRTIRKLDIIYRDNGINGLRFAFQIIEDAGWADDGKAYTEGSLNVGYYAYNECLKKNGKLNKTKYNCLVKILKGYKTSTLYVDEANRRFSETTTKHPEDSVKKLIQYDLECAQAAAEKMLAYQKNYYRQYIKVQ